MSVKAKQLSDCSTTYSLSQFWGVLLLFESVSNKRIEKKHKEKVSRLPLIIWVHFLLRYYLWKFGFEGPIHT